MATQLPKAKRPQDPLASEQSREETWGSMAPSLPAFCLLFALVAAAAAQAANTNTTLFSCSTAKPVSCDTFVLYRTQPGYADLTRISDLFGVSSLYLMHVNDLTSEEGALLPGQLVLIPIDCGCAGNRSFANVTYWIANDDSFYVVSTLPFQNLTSADDVMKLNPTLEPTALIPGQAVLIPVLCKCPDEDKLGRGFKYLVTYVWGPGDDVSKLSKEMNSTPEAIAAANNYRNFSAALALPVLIPVPDKPRLPTLQYSPATPPSASKSNAKSLTKAIVFSGLIGGASAALIGICLLLACCRVSRKEGLTRCESNLEAAVLLTPRPCKKKSQPPCPVEKGNKLLAGVSQFIDKPAVFEIRDVMEATMNLSKDYCIGGAIYQATLNGEVYAVKRTKGDVAGEMNIFQRVNHANLIKLAGFSINGDGNFFMIYEFAENGSLDKWLFDKASTSDSTSYLSWRQRLNIALDVANGLQYLHEHTRPSVVHGGIKSSNILLDAHFKAKLSNFSAAKPATARVRPSADVLGLGVVLLELLTGRKESSDDGGVGVLRREVLSVLEVEEKKMERLGRWMDSKLKGFYAMDGAASLAAMAKACTVEDSTERPRISEIAFGLSVVAQSCSDAFERTWLPSSEEGIPIKDAVEAR